MATSTAAYFAGIGTTFAFLTVGFGGGLMIANSALEPGGHQTRASREAPTSVRVILPNSNEPAQPPQQPHQQRALTPIPIPQAVPQPDAQPVTHPAGQAYEAIEKTSTRKSEAAETKKLESKERERKRRYVERAARRQAEAHARQHLEQQHPDERRDAPVMAFGNDSSPSGGWFGN